MKIDVMSYGAPLADVPALVRAAEEQGHDGWFVGETRHDPLLACVAAGEAGRELQIGTAVAIAFPRSPMQVAHAAHDLQALTGGRFVLGLGTQVRAHVEKRFGASWSPPVPRMREYVHALRAIWECWEHGTRLAFRGEHTRHTLMTPFFTPPAHGHGDPPVWLSAVGPAMTRLCGEVADGILCHPLTSPRYVSEVTLPGLAEGARTAGRERTSVEVGVPVLVATGHDEQRIATGRERLRSQIAFYASTPAYRSVLDLHGWPGLQERLHRLAVAGEWERMASTVDDRVLDAFALTGAPDEVAAGLVARYGGLVDRVSLAGEVDLDAQERIGLVQAIRAALSDAGHR